MKAKIKINLNERTQKPSVNAPNVGYFRPGEEIDIVGIVNGAEVEPGNKVWYELSNGSFVWSGGVEGLRTLSDESESIVGSKTYDEYLKEFNGDGSGVGIAFLDSGVNKSHPLLVDRVKLYESFLKTKSKSNYSSHGTRVAGILASDDPAVKRNKSDLICFRVADKSDKIYNTGVVDALNDIDANHSGQIDVVNMSLDIKSSFITQVQTAIDNLVAKHIIVVVAAGENNFRNNTSYLTNVIKVGAFDDRKIPAILSNGLEQAYDLAFLNNPISSYSNGGQNLDDTISNDSAYTAVVSALIARKIQSDGLLKNATRIQAINQFLKQISEKLDAQTKISPLSPYHS